jgi:hypothetical protein
MTWRSLSAVPTIALLACGITAKRVGEQSAEGAVQSLRRQVEQTPPQEQGVMAEGVARGVVRGGIQELTEPRNIDLLSRGFERGFSSALVQLTRPPLPAGSGGSESPILGFTRENGTAFTGAVLDELAARLAERCHGVDAFECLEARARLLGRATSSGVVQGIWTEMRWPLLGVVFILGLFMGWAGGALGRARSR